MNLLILCIDALRPDHVTPEIMPYLCGLLARGQRFDNVTTPVAHTLPSVSAMLFGDEKAYQHLESAQPKLVEHMNRTHRSGAFIGQAALAVMPELFAGFADTWFCSDASWWGYYPLENVMAEFMAWRQQEQSWFAYVHLFGVHEPYLRGELDLGTTENNLRSDVMTHILHGRFTPVMERESGKLQIPKAARDYLKQLYRTLCQQIDMRLATYWDAIRADTLLVVCSDHGDSHGEEGVWGHGLSEPYQTEAAREVLMAIVPPNDMLAYNYSPPIRSNTELLRLAQPYFLRETDVEAKLKGLGYLG